MARMSAKAQARYDELKRISAKGGSTLMSNSTFEYVAESATEGQFAFFKGVLDNEFELRRASRIARLKRGADFPFQKNFDGFVFVASKKLTKRHVAFEHYGRHVLHYILALPSIKAASMRWLAPLNSTSLPWWTILSIMAEASLSSPRTVPHFENSMFVVNIMLRLS